MKTKEPTKRELTKIANELKAYFTIKKRRLMPTYTPHQRFEKCWDIAAKLVHSIGAEPDVFIDAQFAVPSTHNMPLYPNMLYGDKAMAKYSQLKSRPSAPGKMAFDTQMRYLTNCIGISKNKTLSEILMDPQMPIKNFVRILMCEAEDYEDVNKVYGEQAKRELQSDPGLRRYIKQNYASRYKRIYPERISARDGGPCIEDPGPPSAPGRRKIYPKRRR